jgi:hypothetical protein
MGNWHCIPSNCAEVVYQEYESGKIRWRYGAEPWQEIAADNYSVEQEKGKCNVTYLVNGVAARNGVNYCETPNLLDNNWLFNVVGPVYGLKAQFTRQDDRYSCPNYTSIVGKANLYLAYLSCGLNPNDTAHSIIYFYEPHTINNVVKITSIVRTDGQPDNCGNFVFTITKKGVVVYAETRAVSPEVEKIPCKLSTTKKQIEIRKIPYLDRVEVVDYAYDVRLGLLVDSSNYGFLVAKKPIPSQCLNIYNNSITSTIPTNVANTPENLYLQIAQICSAPGCPPPEYQVICDCNNCESCPDGTCAVECEGQICCYGSNGVSVKSIALENYCGGQS